MESFVCKKIQNRKERKLDALFDFPLCVSTSLLFPSAGKINLSVYIIEASILSIFVARTNRIHAQSSNP